jgi:hypothetical protein
MSAIRHIKAAVAGSAKEQTNDQSQCGFLSRLSLDIRFLIYQDLLADLGRTRHIYQAKKVGEEGTKLKSVKCVADPTLPGNSRGIDFLGNWGLRHEKCSELLHPSNDGSFLSLLMSCKLLYV